MNSRESMLGPGQRVLSDAEPELGLGVVVGGEARVIDVRFPARETERRYARQAAPLRRIMFAPGETVRSTDGLTLTVRGVARDKLELVVYRVQDDHGAEFDLPESELHDLCVPNRPRQKLFAGRLDTSDWFSLRFRARELNAVTLGNPLLGLGGSRVSLLAHQIYVAASVAAREAPRVLLADEVGLGKTIEAGLIMRHLLLSGRASRVLIVVPDSLIHQWLVEMLRRFFLFFAVFDAERMLDHGDGNALLGEQRVLCGYDMLRSHGDDLLAGEWDVLVVDECHHLHWSPEGGDANYDTVAALAKCTPSVLLLTGTPEQFGEAGHFARLRLLDPHRYGEFAAFEREQDAYLRTAEQVRELLETDSAAARSDLAAQLGEPGLIDADSIVARLLDRHGTGRALLRNTRAAVGGFPKRELRRTSLPLPEMYRDIHGIAGLTPELVVAGDWTRDDSRVAWLAAALSGLRPEKVLVICAHAATVMALRDALTRRYALRVAVFHEGMDILERDRAAAWFAAAEDGADALLCSEIGSEGRNFQFLHHLVLFDLPLAPELLEQRIGRLDRIGQQRSVVIHVPYFAEGPQAVMVAWYARALDAFEHVCLAAGALSVELGDTLQGLLSTGNASEIEEFISSTLRRRQVLEGRLAAGRDRLLELHSHDRKRSAQWLEALRGSDADQAVRAVMNAFWDLYGVIREEGPGGAVVLRPGAHMLGDAFPGLPEDGITVTFDRHAALAHEDWAFITREHPMVRGAMDLLLAGDWGTAAFSVARIPGLPTGTLLLEALYVLDYPTTRDLPVARFLSSGAERFLLDGAGRDRALEFGHEVLAGQCMSTRAVIAQAMLASQRKRLVQMFAAADALAADRANERIAQAVAAATETLDADYQRLKALARINANVREQEVAVARERRDAVPAVIAQARPRLDAVRVLVAA